MIEVIDSLVEDHLAILIDDYVRNLSWKYDYESKRGQPNKHWHILCGHDDSECKENNFEWVSWIFQSAKNKIGKLLICLIQVLNSFLDRDLNHFSICFVLSLF